MRSTELSLLSTRRFLPLFITQFLGAFNDNVFKTALVILITYRLADLLGMNSQLLVVFAAGIFILPFFLFSAMAGQLADKFEKSRLIIIIKVIEMVLMLIAALGFHLQNIPLLMLVLFTLGMHATFFGPLKYAILPEQLRENELIAGNGLIEAGTFLAILIGTILGTVVVLYPYGEYLISGIIFFVALMGFSASCYIPNTHLQNPQLNINYRILQETFKLLRYAKETREIYLSILGISWFWLVGAIFLSEFPIFAKDTLHANEHVVTLFLTLFSIGLALGSLLCNRLLKGRVDATYVPLGVIGMTIFILDLYFAAKHGLGIATTELVSVSQFLSTFTGWRISIDLVLTAICGGLYTVPLYAILQHSSEPSHRARVIASNNIMNALFMVTASLFTMLMLKMNLTVIEIFLTVAIINGLVAIYICKLLPAMLVKSIFRFILNFLYRVQVKGLENYYAAGKRVVVVANHTSFIDALLLSVYLPDNLTFAVNTFTVKKWWVRLFARLVNVYVLDPTNPMALKSLIEFVQTDKRCVIFPEGRLTVTGALMKIYEGPGLIADKSQATLLPIHIQGAQLTPFSRLKGKVRIRLMPTITITVFPPKQLNIPKEIKGRARRQRVSYELYDLMAQMVFDSFDYKKTLFTSLLDAKSMQIKNEGVLEDIERIPLTYSTIITRSFILGNVIAKSTKPKEHVGILLPNMSSNVVTFFAMQVFDRVPAMLNYSSGANNVVSACKTAEITTIYTSHRFVQLGKLTGIISALQQENININYLEDIRENLSSIDKLKGLVMGRFPRLSYKLLHTVHPSPDDAAVVLFTSGSEGTPKGVVLSHANLQANRYQLTTSIDFTSNDKVFNALPIFHSFGLTGGLLLPLLSGIKLFLYPSPLHYRIIPEIAYDTNATLFFATDTFLANYAKYAHPYDFYSVRYVFAGAEKLREETRTMWSQKFGVRVFEGYGTTETSPVLAVNTAMQNKVGTVGRLLPGINYRLKSVSGIEEGGSLVVSGPNVMKGYLLADQPGKLIPPQDGWYETGDIVAIDPQGFVEVKGRLKRFAKIAGEMVSLTMVEQYINQLWPKHQHAVIALPDAKKGEQLVLVTTLQHAEREELLRFAKGHGISEIAVPKKIVYIEKMPLLGTGKVDYKAIEIDQRIVS